MTNSKNTNSSSFNPVLLIVIGILVLLLMVASFAIGMLWFKGDGSFGLGTNKNNGEAVNPGNGQKATIEISDLPSIAKEIGLDVDSFQTCLDNKETAEAVQSDYQSGLTAGIAGTPGTIILNTQTGQAKLITGALPYANVKSAIDAMLGTGDATILDTLEDVTDFEALNETDHLRGNKNAKIALIEYSDFECPFCQRFHPTMLRVLNDYADDVTWVYRHFPLDSLHPKARPFALASECAYTQKGDDAFWDMADIFFK